MTLPTKALKPVKATHYVWRKFTGPSRNLPPERRYVLVQTIPPEDHPSGRDASRPVVLVGWLKYAAGDKSCPYFVCPGIGGDVTHWCDCLGDDFEAPGWGGKQTVLPTKRRKKP